MHTMRKAPQAQTKQISLLNIGILLQTHTLSYTCIIQIAHKPV